MARKLPSKFYAKVRKEYDLSVAILCGQPIPRMKSYGSISLTTVNGNPLIIEQINQIRQVFKKCEILVSVGFESSKIIKHIPDVRIIENQLFDTTTDSEELRLIMNNIVNDGGELVKGCGPAVVPEAL